MTAPARTARTARSASTPWRSGSPCSATSGPTGRSNAVAPSLPQEIGPLYRLAIQRLTRVTEHADDSAGVIGDAIDRAVDGYAAACRAAPPDPTELATWMIDFQADGPGWPEVPVADFADALGATGLAAYWRRLNDLSRSPGRDADAVRLLSTPRDLHHRAGTDFTTYLETLQEAHRRKTTFLAELVHAGDLWLRRVKFPRTAVDESGVLRPARVVVQAVAGCRAGLQRMAPAAPRCAVPGVAVRRA